MTLNQISKNSFLGKLLFTKKGELSKNVTNAIGNCTFDKGQRKIYTGYYSGSGRFTSANSAMFTVTDILERKGYKYTTGNDAPRGGASGEYVKVSKTAFKFIQQLDPYQN